ncbi:MAG: hypothetical protein AMXMBFR82_42120 [Candidatus Hydrogenedentota bacterium]
MARSGVVKTADVSVLTRFWRFGTAADGRSILPTKGLQKKLVLPILKYFGGRFVGVRLYAKGTILMGSI